MEERQYRPNAIMLSTRPVLSAAIQAPTSNCIKQDPNAGNSHITTSTAEISSHAILVTTGHLRSMPIVVFEWQGMNDFLLVFYRDLRPRWTKP